MKWNKKIFIDNIDYLVKKHCDGIQKKLNDKIGQVGAVTKWKTTETVPSLEAILKIYEEFNCDIRWLLTGDKASNPDPEWTFDPKVRDRYDFLQKVVSEVNEGAKDDFPEIDLIDIVVDALMHQRKILEVLKKNKSGKCNPVR